MSILIRADASRQIGTGHVMRSIALAQACQDRGLEVRFLFSDHPSLGGRQPALEARLTREGIPFEYHSSEPGSKDDALETLKRSAEWIVVDGYHFRQEFQDILKSAGRKILVLDDFGHSEYYHADVILNQNYHANESTHLAPRDDLENSHLAERDEYSQELRDKCDPGTRLLLGTQYVLMRREFRRWCDWQREVPNVARKILVTLGGSDPDNATAKVLEVLRLTPIDNLEAVVLVGASNPRFDELAQLASAIPDRQIRLIRDAGDMPSLMAWADLAIGAGGTTTWEFLFFGLSPLLIVLADNQIDIAESLHRDRLAYDMGWHHSLDTVKMASELARISANYEERSERAIRARELVDGRGAERVAAILAGE